MSRSKLPESVNDLERTRVEELVAKFAQAWRGEADQQSEVFLSMFLPPPEDRLYLLILHQLIPTDLAYRWRKGEAPLLEQYVESFPELGTVDDLPVELIYDEYRIRNKLAEPPPNLETYQKRFPKQFATLRGLLTQTMNASLTRSLPEFEIPLVNRTRDTDKKAGLTHISSSLPADSSLLFGETLQRDSGASGGNLASSSRKIRPEGEGYHLIECIGHGAFADVWRAEAPGGVEVAVKIIRWTASNKLSQVELRALELIKKLRHAFLLQVQAYWLSEGQLYVVMDLAERTLLQRLEECKERGLPGIPPHELLIYMHEVAEALDFLHARDVLHRDIKPANIMLASGHAKLADFGLARLVLEKGTDLHATTTGTPLYMSPEVWGNKVGPGSDQYSLAATYVELRLGRPLFRAESYSDVMQQHLSTRPDLKPLSAAEQRVLHRALAKESEQRYASCKEFIVALQEAVDGPKQSSGQWTRRGLLAVGLLAVAAGAAGLSARAWWPWRPLQLTVPANLEVAAGDGKEFEIHLAGTRSDKPKEPVFRDLPPGVVMQVVDTPVNVAGGGDNALAWRFRAVSDLNLPEESYNETFRVQVAVTTGDQSVQRTIKLTILPPQMVLPAHCTPAPGAERVHVTGENKNYWSRIVRPLPSGAMLAKPCEFVLVPYDKGGHKLPTFYMQENKVWNELFAAFNRQQLREHPDLAEDETWPADWQKHGAAQGAGEMPADDYPLHPVMRTNYAQAKAFAAWLGAKLPTCAQWDTAAGFYLPEAQSRLGPFEGTWGDDSTQRPQVAIDRVETGTLPVGEARDDVSPFGIRDLSGNGYEWTRDVSAEPFSQVTLRGRPYDKRTPLFYDHLREDGRQLDNTRQNEVGSQDPLDGSPYIGLRLVIEP